MTHSNSCVRTLGVDLASAAKKTGVCVLAWDMGFARVETLEVGADDAEIVALQRQCDATGIDAPFGWPEPFKTFLARGSGAYLPDWTEDYRDQMRFRRTDHSVKKVIERWPLSVSSDLIAVPAMRCAGLLARLGVEDFSGDGRVFEVYPAAALYRWKLMDRGYKGAKGEARRALLVDELLSRAPWLRVDQGDFGRMRASDDAFDALICALVARAASLGLTDGPPSHDRELACQEGWIHLPAVDSLERLGEGG